MRIVCLSDTHGDYDRWLIPPGDVLVHVGDLLRNNWRTTKGLRNALEEARQWFARQPHPVKIFVPGNHDDQIAASRVGFQRRLPEVICLFGSGVVVETVKFWGGNTTRKCVQCPSDTDILLTHESCDADCAYRTQLQIFGHRSHTQLFTSYSYTKKGNCNGYLFVGITGAAPVDVDLDSAGVVREIRSRHGIVHPAPWACVPHRKQEFVWYEEWLQRKRASPVLPSFDDFRAERAALAKAWVQYEAQERR